MIIFYYGKSNRHNNFKQLFFAGSKYKIRIQLNLSSVRNSYIIFGKKFPVLQFMIICKADKRFTVFG